MQEKQKALVIKFGGSVATNIEGANEHYLRNFFEHLGLDVLSSVDRLGLLIGGGPRVRELQKSVSTNYEKDMIAREAMWEHAESLRTVAEELGLDPTEAVPHSSKELLEMLPDLENKTVVASWLKDGQSSDASAISLAEAWVNQGYEAAVVILSNVAHIFTADPKKDDSAKPISYSSVDQLVKEGVLIDDPSKFTPGMSVTIDPIAVRTLKDMRDEAPTVFFGNSESYDDVRSFLIGESIQSGTILDPAQNNTEYFYNNS